MTPSTAIRMAILALTLSADASAKTARGVVVDSDDRPVAKATVILKGADSLIVRSFITEKDGSFHFVNLHPDLYYKIQARFGRAETNEVSISRFDSLRDETIQLKFSVRREQLR